jgi:hypothetical protein
VLQKNCGRLSHFRRLHFAFTNARLIATNIASFKRSVASGFPVPPGRSGIDLENSIALFPEFAARPGVLFFLLCRRRQTGKSKQSLRF